MAKTGTRRYDPVNDLKSEEDVIGYLEAVLENSNPAEIAAALDDIVRAGRVHGRPESRKPASDARNPSGTLSRS